MSSRGIETVQTPFRLKMKFIDYLRLHRMVTNVSPKHIWEVLSNGLTSEMEEYIKNSTPWFARFAQKWARALTTEYNRLEYEANKRYACSGVNPNDYWYTRSVLCLLISTDCVRRTPLNL